MHKVVIADQDRMQGRLPQKAMYNTDSESGMTIEKAPQTFDIGLHEKLSILAYQSKPDEGDRFEGPVLSFSQAAGPALMRSLAIQSNEGADKSGRRRTYTLETPFPVRDDPARQQIATLPKSARAIFEGKPLFLELSRITGEFRLKTFNTTGGQP